MFALLCPFTHIMKTRPTARSHWVYSFVWCQCPFFLGPVHRLFVYRKILDWMCLLWSVSHITRTITTARHNGFLWYLLRFQCLFFPRPVNRLCVNRKILDGMCLLSYSKKLWFLGRFWLFFPNTVHWLCVNRKILDNYNEIFWHCVFWISLFVLKILMINLEGFNPR